jgi:hypothetical protein
MLHETNPFIIALTAPKWFFLLVSQVTETTLNSIIENSNSLGRKEQQRHRQQLELYLPRLEINKHSTRLGSQELNQLGPSTLLLLSAHRRDYVVKVCVIYKNSSWCEQDL